MKRDEMLIHTKEELKDIDMSEYEEYAYYIEPEEAEEEGWEDGDVIFNNHVNSQFFQDIGDDAESAEFAVYEGGSCFAMHFKME